MDHIAKFINKRGRGGKANQNRSKSMNSRKEMRK